MLANCRRRSGFTLVELTVALVISALVVLGARTLIEQLGQSVSRAIAVTASEDRIANGEHLLRGLVGQMEIGTDESTRFQGGPADARFGTWCEVPAGWAERCRVALSVRDSVLTATMSTGDTVVVLLRRRRIELRYLEDPRAGGRWFSNWADGTVVPLAIGVISIGDTTILRVGERG